MAWVLHRHYVVATPHSDARLDAREMEATRAFLRLAPMRPGIVTSPGVGETTLSMPAPGEATLTGPAPAEPAKCRWILESVAEGGRELRRMRIEPLPFRIGREPGLELVLPSHRVSKRHAEIFESNGALWIRDLHSRNGTFVNHRLVAEAALEDGHILHLGDFEFRIGRRDAPDEEREDGSTTASFDSSAFSHQFVQGTRELKELLEQRAVTVDLQPIVRLPGGVVAAYEALGRGTHPGLPRSPVELLRIAEGMGAAPELSRLFRRQAVEMVHGRPGVTALFLNAHPAELGAPGLLESVEGLRALAPHLDLTLEIHESALAQPTAMAALRDQLSDINVGLAYDDFGSGQARLLELAEAPPRFLKFDRRFVAGIDAGPPSRRRLLKSLVAAARELLVNTIAEGVETPAEAEACIRLGFTHAQGYHFGRPGPVDAL
jgi:EAL domain-containing protein (putative c-di-GMP-specific phosphodiesterase class I)